MFPDTATELFAEAHVLQRGTGGSGERLQGVPLAPGCRM
jgi:hypothetical protein